MNKWWAVGGAAVVGALLIASIVLALTEREAEFQEGTPERAVQQMLTAAEADDYAAVREMLSQDLSKDCTLDRLTKNNLNPSRTMAENRITLVSARLHGDNAVVVSRATRIQGSGPFGTEESSWEQVYNLTLEGGEWRFSSMPWPFGWCGPVTPEPVVPKPPPATD